MIDYTTITCPICGGRLCVDVQYPDRLFCDTCEYPDNYELSCPDASSDLTLECD